jgi:hypothetical protein
MAKVLFVYLTANSVAGKKAEDSIDTDHSAIYHVYDVSL